jgi:pyruvate/oxaloacetate carboxyltransferase
MTKPLKITELALRDAHQSLLATRMRIEDMLPIAPKLDQIGFWSLETWGGATFDACIRYLGEDPWERLRQLKKALPKTRQQMLLRGQNLLGYRHYSDDVVEAFVERAATNGIDVFRIFDALNDMRNLETAVKAAIKTGKHAQGTMSYTVSPVHTMEIWVSLGKRIEDMGCHSICIKDMAGLLKPYVAEELVSRLKESCAIPVAMQSHATTGMSTVTNIKAAEAGIDMIDTATSSLSMTYGHSATESVVAILQGTERDTLTAIPQLPEQELALHLEADHEEEERHEPVVDDVLQILRDHEVAHLHGDLGEPEVLVGPRRDVRPDERGDRRRQQHQATGGLQVQELLHGTQHAPWQGPLAARPGGTGPAGPDSGGCGAHDGIGRLG